MDGSVAIGLYRHALTEENIDKKYIGWHDAPLIETERLKLGEKSLLYPAYDLIFTSDLKRCKDTAEALFPNTPIVETSLLREIHFGQWETKTYEDLRTNRQYCNWLNDQNLKIPGGESLGELEERLERFWEFYISDRHTPEFVEKTKERNGSFRAALVTHGGVLRHFLTKWASEPKSFWEWKIPFAKGYELSWSAEEWRRKSKCSSLLEVPSTGRRNG
jgi:alpha-ribazole phosphatase